MTFRRNNLLVSSLQALLFFFALSVSATEDNSSIFHAVREDEDDGAAIRSWVEKDSSLLESVGTGGQSPLIHAVLQGKFNSVKTLLELGADVTATEKDGYNVLHAAGFQGRAKILQLLLDHFEATTASSSNMNLVTDQHADGYFPLHRACWGREHRHSETVRVMLKNGVPHDQMSREGRKCEEMTRNEETIAVIVEARDGYEL